MEDIWPEGQEAAISRSSELLQDLVHGSLPSEEFVYSLLRRAVSALDKLPTLVEVDVPPGGCMHVVGDLHGQFPELLRVLNICGLPKSGKNLLLFNGDFVDRGPRSVEVLLLILALFVAHPHCLLLNRGNHETPAMNRAYGFEEEVKRKYSPDVFEGFQEAFCRLPLATVVNRSVLVLHGGLFGREGVTLRDLAAINRRQRNFHSGIAMDVLWSDPCPEHGKHQSPRGAGVLFGPDVTERFCLLNGLQCCVRSHEVELEGYRWQDGGRCVTVFSAANYMGRTGNLGAVCHLKPKGGDDTRALAMTFTTFAGAGARRRSRL